MIAGHPNEDYTKFDFTKEGAMQISKLDDTLIVRLPDEVIESLELKEGDEVDLHITRKSAIEPLSEITREEAIDRLRAMSITFPPDFKFDREEANSR